MYKCLKSNFGKLEKRINKITKKLDKYNLNYKFEILQENVEEISIIDPINNSKKRNVFVEVIEYEFSMDTLKLGNYNVIAILKHNQIENSNMNLIYYIDKQIKLPDYYKTVEGKCQHCSTNRKRNTTVILVNLDNPNELLQVGVSCLKEYTGITDVDVISNLISLQDMFEDIGFEGGFDNTNIVIDTLSYLAKSIELIETEGYIKDITKEKAFYKVLRNEEIEDKYMNQAKDVLKYFANKSYDNNFLENTRLLLSNTYNKISGFIPYSYIAYNKELEKEKKAVETSEQVNSNYVGEINERLELDVTILRRYVFNGAFGPIQIYLFKDTLGNIYKWKTSVFLTDKNGQSIELTENQVFKLKGSIKGHEEYKGTKQTELTRCKIIN